MIYLNIGRRERGKTTLAYYMARKIPRRIILDPRRMIQRGDTARVETIEDLHVRLEDEEQPEVVYQPADDDLEMSFQRFTRAAKAIALDSDQPLAVMVDEASFYNLDHPTFQWLAKCTPRDQVHLIITAHRPSDVPTTIRAIADHWCIFATTQEHDLKAIESRTGNPGVTKAIRRLEGRQYVHWDDAHGKMGVNVDSIAWFVSMSSASVLKTSKLIESSEPEWELD